MGRNGCGARQGLGAPADGHAPVGKRRGVVEGNHRRHQRHGCRDEQHGVEAPAARDHRAPGRLKKTLKVALPDAVRRSAGSASSASSLALAKLYETTVSCAECEML